MIEAKNLTKNYKSKSGVTTKALDDVSLKIQKKGMVFILGKSGSGKSTLLNVLGGLDSIDGGEIIIKGKSSASFKQSHFDSYRNTYVGFIFQEYNILDDFTVGQNIALAMKLQNRKPTSEDINSILKQVDLDGLGDRKPNELSGGQKQRVAIARALIKNPQIIMADEPTGALDSVTGIQIFDTLKKLSKDKLVLIVSHDREFSERYADRIIELKDGKIISDVENANKKGGQTEGITCVGNEVIVRQDYELTSKDLKAINDFLKKNKKDIKIKTGAGRLSKSSFVNTKENNIDMDTSGFNLIKSKLPLSHAFKMGTSALKHKKVKLVITIFLSLVSFTMLGMSAAMGFYNPTDVHVNTLYKSNLNFSYWQKRLQGKEQYDWMNGSFTTEDIKTIEKETNMDMIPVCDDYYSLYNNLPDEGGHGHSMAYPSNLGGLVSLTKDNIDNLNMELNGKLPANDNEIAIPYFIANVFVHYGYCDVDESGQKQEKQKISEVSEMKDKNLWFGGRDESGTLKKLKITGIVDTSFDYWNKKYSDIMNENSESYSQEFSFFANNSLANKLIVNQLDVSEGQRIRTLIGALPNNKNSIKKLCGVSDKKFQLNDKDIEEYANAKYKRYALSDYLTEQVTSITNSFNMMKQIFLYIGLGFILFSGLLLANFIANSITYQRKQIGILRAIGARGRDIFKIYMSESFVIALINFVLSTIASYSVITFAIVPGFAKSIGGIELFSFNFIEVGLILVVSFVSAFLATFIPVYHIARRKPIDTIRLK